MGESEILGSHSRRDLGDLFLLISRVTIYTDREMNFQVVNCPSQVRSSARELSRFNLSFFIYYVFFRCDLSLCSSSSSSFAIELDWVPLLLRVVSGRAALRSLSLFLLHFFALLTKKKQPALF